MIHLIKPTRILAALACLLLAAAACQPAPRVESQGDYILQITQIDTTNFPVVDVYVSVQDASGEPQVINTGKLQLLENGQPVQGQSIRGVGEAGPLTTLLVIDNSGSMNFANKLNSAKAVAKQYLAQMRPNDQAGIITFNTKVQTVKEITTDRQALEAAVDGIQARDDTAIYDALLAAVQQLNPLPGRKAIILLTDGMDNRSSALPEDVLGSIGFGGLSISTVGFGEIPEGEEDPDAYAGIDETVMRRIAEDAGGRYGYAANESELSALYSQMQRALQSEAVISYTTPLALRDGVLRALTVTLSDRYLGVGGESRTGYNPGGLVPEVAQPASWLTFGIILAILVILLLIPVLYQVVVQRKPAKRKVRIRLKD